MAVGFQLGAVAAGAGRLVSRLRRLLGGIRTAISRIPLTTYAYDAAGALATIAYSDDTPGVTFTYDRLGRMASATVAGVSTNLFAYDALDLVAETQNGVVLSRATDALGREQSLFLNSGYQAV